MQNDYLVEVRHTFESIAEQVDQSFSKLTERQLNWKPVPDAWSIAQCLDHLMTINQLYFPQFKAIGDETYTPRFWHKVPLLEKLWGSLLRKSVEPSNKKKSKTFAMFNPAISDSRVTILKEFQQHQIELIRLLDRTEGVDHKKVKVNSPASRFVTLSLENCWKILASHEERHFRQAKRLTEMPRFPKARVNRIEPSSIST